MKRFLKDAAKRAMLAAYRAGDRLGVHILPAHFYSTVPSVHELDRTRARWLRRSSMAGIRVDLGEQARTLESWVAPFKAEYAGNPHYMAGVKAGAGPGYGFIEAQALHGVVRHLKPRRIIEVGSGVSTACTLAAEGLNRGEGAAPARITCIEPYPSAWLRGQTAVTLRAEAVQEVPAAFFRELEAGDFLFIDTSHTVKPGSDVNYLFLEVLPVLRPGVVVHIHDIYFPFDYQRDLFHTVLFATESTLLQGVLAHSPRYEILFCLSHLHYDKQEVMRRVFPEYTPEPGPDGLRPRELPAYAPPPGHFPSSIYLRVTDR